jgi:hypothetical protein
MYINHNILHCITTMRPHTPLWLCGCFGLQKHGSHPPPLYSPDLALWEFLLFPQDEGKFKVRRSDNAEEIQAE